MFHVKHKKRVFHVKHTAFANPVRVCYTGIMSKRGGKKMKAKRILCTVGCAAGGVLVGVFAGKLNEPVGIALFAAGVLFLCKIKLF